LHQDIKRIPSDRVLLIQYESFCKNPDSVLRLFDKKIVADFKNTGVSSFVATRKSPKNKEEERLLELVGSYEFTR
jgi:hypothetical protein